MLYKLLISYVLLLVLYKTKLLSPAWFCSRETRLVSYRLETIELRVHSLIYQRLSGLAL